MSITSTAALVDALRQLRLLDAKQLEELPSLQARFPEAKDLSRELMQRNWLTAYQANNLLLGKGQSLVLGSYVLLERLGAGGMGEVFKGRHHKLHRVAALKLIHKKHLDSPDAVRRFQREVRAAAALDHPNIVLAYDADQIGDTHLFVMEYIEGALDLARLVKSNGPLPVSHACEYVRQTALGLQHAYERGMVHRDIKPANLLLTTSGMVVKILDMGLARLDSSSDDDRSGTMTQEGTVMGTPDYMAPEQAEDSHRVDIRADLYSLGCTLYFLLTGQVPFPSGNLIEKLLKHRLDEPRLLRQLRPDVPPGVEAIVRKLMAKKPEDRYQTPAEVAAALASVNVVVSSNPVSNGEQTIAVAPEVSARDIKKAYDSALKYMAKRDDTVALDSPFALRRKAKDRKLAILAVAAGVVALIATVILIRVVSRQPGISNNTQGEGNQPVVAENQPTKKSEGPKPGGNLLDGPWYYIGPFDNSLDKNGFDTVYPPEKGVDLKASYTGKNNEKVRWNEYKAFQSGVLLDFLPLFNKGEQQIYACIYLFHEINVDEATSMPISLGSDDTLTLWLNDERLVSVPTGRTLKRDSNFATLKLKAGTNKLLVKICQRLGAWGFYIAPNGSKTKLFYENPAYERWSNQVALMSAENQVKEVETKLRELNPGFAGKVEPRIEGGVVTELSFGAMGILDISPVRALRKLKKLECCGDINGPRSRFSDLSPLKGMQLTSLGCWFTLVSNLSPLQDMELTALYCYNTEVWDLSPLKNMKLTDLHLIGTGVYDLSPLKNMNLSYLWCSYTRVSDLSPLKNMQLASLDCKSTQISDLSPLKNMKLRHLDCNGSNVSDLSVLKEMPIKDLGCDFKVERDAEILRSIKTLETINGKPAKEIWDEVDQMKLNKKP